MVFGEAIESDWLDRRRAFCKARIEARAEVGLAGRSGLILAGLHKELAAILLLQGDIEPARKHLIEAGDFLVRQRIAHGLVLQGLAGLHSVHEAPLARGIIEVASRLDDTRGVDEPRVKGADHYAPLQWLAVVQASVLGGDADLASAAVLVERLRPQASVTMANGLPLGLYLDLLSPRAWKASMADDLGEDLSTVLSWRRRRLRIAREDRYHWQATLDVAALVDFDLLALFSSPMFVGIVELSAGIEREDDTLDRLPMILAAQLRASGEANSAPL